MRITFHIHFRTHWGQYLAVAGNHPLLGNGQDQRAVPMHHQGDGHWILALDIPDQSGVLAYRYLFIDENTQTQQREWGNTREITLRPTGDLHAKDAWRSAEHPDNALYTAPFRDVLMPVPEVAEPEPAAGPGKIPVRWQLFAPRTHAEAELIIMGNVPELGAWAPDRGVKLGSANYPLWQTEVHIRPGQHIAYKFAWRQAGTGKLLDIETGENRTLFLPAGRQESWVITDDYYAYADGGWKGAGVAIPVFSLRSEEGMGIGEFADLKAMADWAAASGMKMVQILPVNDTIATRTWADSYPYAAISVFALNPVYLRIADMEGAERVIDDLVAKKQRELNRLPQVDLQEVLTLKEKLTRALYKQEKETFFDRKSFQAYYSANKHWLDAYAVFCYLRDTYGTADFTQWEEHAVYDAERIARMCTPGADTFAEIGYWFFIQYYLDQQLREAAAYAHEKGVILKGDIPIGIYRHSVDAWVAPHLYHMDAQAGAPPDPFSDTGQNWGFPTYNWPEMAKDNYQWWRDRMTQLSRYFDTYRIDHILGFFRIWQIPQEEVVGTMGYFYPAISVAREEFAERGLTFDYDRYCLPYITDDILADLFGAEAAAVKEQFLEPRGERYQFQASFSTQRAILSYLEEHPGQLSWKQPLFDLIGNRLFIVEPDDGEGRLHPRIELMKTSSFAALAPYARQQVHEMYIDYYYRRQEDFWRERAMEKLPALRDATDMLICGEDLGMVPSCVPDVMRKLSILSLEIQRMSKNPDTEFLQEKDIPYLSVASPSTHDMAPIRAWWEEEDWAYIQRFYEQELHLEGTHPITCEPYVAQAIIRQHLQWPSMWTVFPLQDLLAMDGRLRLDDPFAERINVPANPNHYWRYRMHLTLEELLEEKPFLYLVKAMLQNAGRV